MARPREFDETAVLDAAMQCFWAKGFEATSVRKLADSAGIAGASLYNSFGDKRGLYDRALKHYVANGFLERAERFESTLAPLAAIEAFFEEIVRLSLRDKERKGCMLVNSAAAPPDAKFQKMIAGVLVEVEQFFLRVVKAGQKDGSISQAQPAADLARLLLSLLLGVRVLARTRPERALLEGAVAPALALIKGSVRR
ncbi:MAG TPA: TetR/AcrR family transcriptional regulator [Rhizomicrobium sp.]|jgi:TetR/AcrR family transcriptional repressor of nem operon